MAMNGFYMMSREVTNLDYKEFLFHVKATGSQEDYEKVRVHSEGWSAFGKWDDASAARYFENSRYDEFPVVNITQEAARMFCKWLAQAIEVKNPNFQVEVRLPTETEWSYAAQGGIANAPYPNGNYLRSLTGQYFYNFRVVGDESIHQDPDTREFKVKPSRPVGTFDKDFYGPLSAVSVLPNGYGLYNTSGNVAEMVQEDGRTKGGSFNNTGYDIRIDAPDPYAGFTGSSPFIGFRVLLTVKERVD